MFAGHLPYVWDQKGPTTDKIADDVTAVPGGKGRHAVVGRGAARCSSAPAPSAADRADRVVVALQMANGGDVIKAQVALNQFKATAARDAKRPLSYANVRSVQVRMRATGMGIVTVDLPRRRDGAGQRAGDGRSADASPAAPASGAASGRRREGELRSLDLLLERRCARRLRQQPDSRSRRRPAQRRRRRRGRRHRISARASGLESTGVVAADRQDREVASPRPTASRSSCSSARRIRSSIS